MSLKSHKKLFASIVLSVFAGLIIGATFAHITFTEAEFTPTQTSRSLLIDLDARIVVLKENNVAIAYLPLVALPVAGSPWEIGPGRYKIGAREEHHISPLSGVRYSYVIQVNGNAFLHGPRESLLNTAAVGATQTDSLPSVAKDGRGSLELAPKDAERLFRFVATGDTAEVSGGRSGLANTLTEVGNFVEQVFAQVKEPAVRAEAYLVGDLASGAILMERNADMPLPIASVTKLITGRVVEKKLDSEATTKVSSRASATYGSQGELRAGETLSVKELLYPLFLESSNDAAEVLAEFYGRDKFISAMNDEAKSLGMRVSSFTDPAGLDPKSVSSARDLFTLANELYKSDTALLERTRVKEVNIGKHLWRNTNKLVASGDQRYLGGKTGYIPEAGLTSVSLFSFPMGEFSKKDLAIILLHSINRDKDITSILHAFVPEANLAWDSSVEEQVPRNDKISLLFVGDIMMSRAVANEVRSEAKGDYGFLFNFAPLIKTADIAFGNLEGPLSDKGYDLRNLYSFRMEPSSLVALDDAGFDVLSVANNHMGDWGRAAFEDTLARLRSAGIAPVGAGDTGLLAREPAIIEKNGIKIGFLGFSDVGPQWLSGPTNQPVILMASNPDIKTIIENAKQKVDHLVVSFHFGEEYKKEPTARQIDFAHRAVNAGADIVVGTHPHVVEPVERYNGSVIAYSLGNFIFDQSFSEDTMEGLALELAVSKTEIIEVKERRVKINSKFQPTLQ